MSTSALIVIVLSWKHARHPINDGCIHVLWYARRKKCSTYYPGNKNGQAGYVQQEARPDQRRTHAMWYHFEKILCYTNWPKVIEVSCGLGRSREMQK